MHNLQVSNFSGTPVFRSSQELALPKFQFVSLETRRLGQVNFRKDFWECYQGHGKKVRQ